MNNANKFELLIQQFNLTTLPQTEWTHHAHLIVALWHVKQHGFADALCQLRSKIILLNKFHGTPNNSQSGYHETLTVFWCHVMDAYLKKSTDSFEEIVIDFLASPLASKALPFDFYKKEELLSAEYRAFYHKPTLNKIEH